MVVKYFKRLLIKYFLGLYLINLKEKNVNGIQCDKNINFE